MLEAYIIPIALFVVGLILIIKGGDWFVDSASWIAEVAGVPKFIIGATIVSLATTLPEMIVSITATIKGQVDMAAGNAIGSVTANTALIMGIFIVCMPGIQKRKTFAPKATMMLFASIFLFIGCYVGKETFIGSTKYDFSLSTVGTILLLAVFIVFFIENFVSMKKDSVQIEPSPTNIGIQEEDNIVVTKGNTSKSDIAKNVALFIVGAAGIAVGAQLLVKYGEVIAVDIFKVPERVVSVLLIAIGTSLPELVTTITALRKKQGELSVGNILGANIIDLTLILTICSFISMGKGTGALAVSKSTTLVDIPVCIGAVALATIPTMLFKKFGRWQGIVMILGYVAYCVLTVTVLQTI